jgi:hypothetical protein
MLRRASLGGVFLLAAACSSSDEPTAADPNPNPPKAHYPPSVLPPLVDTPTTLDRTIIPMTAHQASSGGPNPALPDALADYLKREFGETVTGPGEPYVTRVIDNSEPPPPGPNAKRVLRFAHIADFQIADDESPTRLGQFDGDGPTNAALRPQDAYLCSMANASVRTIDALHRKDPFAFTLLGGDNGDSVQTNEEDWILGILSGADDIECDSGDDDDLIDGPGNDGKDPFKPEGLAMPWKWVTGNHDVLVQGNLVADPSMREKALGTDATGGTRFYNDGKQGAVERGDGVVVADPRRALLSRQDLMAKVASDKDGHGLGDAEKASGMATYTFDADGTAFRFLVLDTAHANGGAEGVITQGEVDRVIKPALEKAKADGKWVILASHHSVANLGDGTGLGGTKEPDALTQDQWSALVGGYPNVVFSLVGHSHRHRVRAIEPAGGHAWWEVMTSAIADFPHQFRTIELFDQDNGWIMMRATCVDFSVDGDPVAAEGRRRGIVDIVSGWLPPADTTTSDRNVELWIKKPQP